jgi:hypothetical protein
LRIATVVRTVTGAIDVESTNVSAGPGAFDAVPRICSTTDVPSRGADDPAPSVTGSTRTSRGPSAPGATNKVAGPSIRARGRSDTRPAHASGAALAS